MNAIAPILAVICALVGLVVLSRISANAADAPDKIEPGGDGQCPRCGRPIPIDDEMEARVRGDA